MNGYKKLSQLGLVASLVFGLAACGQKESDEISVGWKMAALI